MLQYKHTTDGSSASINSSVFWTHLCVKVPVSDSQSNSTSCLHEKGTLDVDGASPSLLYSYCSVEYGSGPHWETAHQGWCPCWREPTALTHHKGLFFPLLKKHHSCVNCCVCDRKLNIDIHEATPSSPPCLNMLFKPGFSTNAVFIRHCSFLCFDNLIQVFSHCSFHPTLMVWRSGGEYIFNSTSLLWNPTLAALKKCAHSSEEVFINFKGNAMFYGLLYCF